MNFFYDFYFLILKIVLKFFFFFKSLYSKKKRFTIHISKGFLHSHISSKTIVIMKRKYNIYIKHKTHLKIFHKIFSKIVTKKKSKKRIDSEVGNLDHHDDQNIRSEMTHQISEGSLT